MTRVSSDGKQQPREEEMEQSKMMDVFIVASETGCLHR